LLAVSQSAGSALLEVLAEGLGKIAANLGMFPHPGYEVPGGRDGGSIEIEINIGQGRYKVVIGEDRRNE
jgi:hypothetical protein